MGCLMKMEPFVMTKGRKMAQTKLETICKRYGYHPSKEQLRLLLEELECYQTVYVRITDRPEKFLNQVLCEDVYNSQKNLISFCSIIYGDCLPGVFKNRQGILYKFQGFLNTRKDCAVVKKSKEITCNGKYIERVELMLFKSQKTMDRINAIYEMKRHYENKERLEEECYKKRKYL